MKNEFLYFRS